MSIVEKEKETIITSGNKYKEYRALKFWIFESMMLIKTKMRMRLGERTPIIQLPNPQKHMAWKDPCNLPNKVEYISTYWLKVDVSIVGD